MRNIRKVIVAIVGVVLLLINNIWGVDLISMEPEITKAIEESVNVVVGILTVFGVYQVPNTQKGEVG